jgi:hypothetical protein
MLSNITKDLLVKLQLAMKKPENIQYLENELLNPIIKHCINQLFPYYILIVSIFVLVLILVIILLFIVIKILSKNV